MANEDHIALLKKGVTAWNAWRKENRHPDLEQSEVNLVTARLLAETEAKLAKARLLVDLSGANLSLENLAGAQLFAANLRGAKLTGANLRRAVLSGRSGVWSAAGNIGFLISGL
jgi:uncharacterized protein YjbI with pentapeptide repeats